MEIAIIGAGLAGLACAGPLQDAGHAVALFDKGRSAGGRTATRRVAVAGGEVAFDHGAQYFTARDPAFVGAVERWAAAGIVARWPAAGADAWVGTPGMNAMVKAMAAPPRVHWSSRVEAIRRAGGAWRLDPVADRGFDAVIVAVPAEQAATLLAAHDPAMAAVAEASPSAPCWTAMAAFGERIAIDADVIRDAGLVGWAARDSAKPGRDGPEAWVVQAGPDWSRVHLENEAAAVADTLLAALAAYASRPLPAPIVRIGHRWRFARAHATKLGALWNGEARVGAAGDWLVGPRIEGAWLSGHALADRILADGG